MGTLQPDPTRDPRTLVLVDAGLRSLSGHHAVYARSVGEGAQARGLTFRVMGPCQHDPALRSFLPVEPIFHGGSDLGRIGLPGVRAWRNMRQFRADLKQLVRQLPAQPTVILVDNTDHHDLLRWAASLDLLPARHPWTWVFMLRRVYYDVDRDRWPHGTRHLRLAFRLLAGQTGRRRIRLVSDSERLIAHYHTLTRAPIHLLPIPHTHADAARPAPSDPGALQVVFLGDARAEKGLAALAHAIAQLRTHPQGRSLRFTLQTHQASGRDPVIDQALADLRANSGAAITLLDQPLSVADYQRLLHQADVVLCPYARARYQTTSGPFTEALAAGKPVLVTDSTWMSDQLQIHGAGVVCRDGDAASIAQGLLQIQQRYPELAQRAAEKRTAWSDLHNPQNFVDTLLRVAGAPA